MEKLSTRQKKFAREWIKNGGNDYNAAVNAGYSDAYAKSSAKKIRENVGVKAYIAKLSKPGEEKELVSLQDIQNFRARVMLGKEKDAFDLDADLNTRLKAASELEKALKIREEEEAKKKAIEEALAAGTFHMDLDIVADVFHPMIRDIRNGKHSEYDLPGGRGSTKSSAISCIITELIKNNHNMHALVLRKVGNTIRDSVYAQFKWAIQKMQLEEQFEFKLSPLEIVYKPTQQKIYFRGADDPLKIKSIKPEFGYIGIIWFEELDQFAGPEEIRNIEQSAIRGGDVAYKFKSFNPPRSKNNWANEYIAETKRTKKDAVVQHSTYRDVPEEWLGQKFIDDAEHLKEVNPEAYRNEYEGEANGTGGNVFEFLEEREITDEEITTFDRIYQGVDWGWYPDPFAFVRSYYDAAHETIYIFDEHRANKTKNTVTGQWIIDKHYIDYYVTCDSAEKKSVADFRDMGIPAILAEKGPGSVEYGMKWLQGKKIVVDPIRCPHAAKELREYEYERDKDGNIMSGYPDKNNHFIDALRYSYEKFYNRRGNNA